MSDYFGGQTRDELEAVLRRLIEHGAEGPKVDFKRTISFADKSTHAEFAKDLSSIANTDDDQHFGDSGYIILGAERGKLVGAVAELNGDLDKLQSRVTDIVKGYLAPVPTFTIVAFDDAELGRWGAIVIPPSSRQPHLFVRDGAGDVVKHEWWVRVNDSKDRAGVQDYARILGKAVSHAMRPFERELQRISLMVEQHPGAVIPASIMHALQHQASAPQATRASIPTGDAVASVRALLLQGPAIVEDSLVAEALRVAVVMAENTPQNPFLLSDKSEKELSEIISYLEDQTFPLAEALATAARYDRNGELTPAICRALRIIAEEPRPSEAHWSELAQFRTYPLALCLYALIMVAVNEERASLIQSVLRLKFRTGYDAESLPIVAAIMRSFESYSAFKLASGKEQFVPVAVRVREHFAPRFTTLLAGTPAADAFALGEFVLALAFLDVSDTFHSRKMPLPGAYLYESSSGRTIRTFLRERPEWLGSALGSPLDKLLTAFDETVEQVTIRSAWSFGFVGGAMDAYRQKPHT